MYAEDGTRNIQGGGCPSQARPNSSQDHGFHKQDPTAAKIMDSTPGASIFFFFVLRTRAPRSWVCRHSAAPILRTGKYTYHHQKCRSCLEIWFYGMMMMNDVLTLLIAHSLTWLKSLSMVTKTRAVLVFTEQKKRISMGESKQVRISALASATTAVPPYTSLRRGNGTISSCGIPSCIITYLFATECHHRNISSMVGII